MVPCDAEYRLKAGDQVFVSAPRLAPKLRYPTHWALGAGQLGGGQMEPTQTNFCT